MKKSWVTIVLLGLSVIGAQAAKYTLVNSDNAEQGEVRLSGAGGAYDITNKLSLLAGSMRVGEYNQGSGLLARSVVKFDCSSTAFAAGESVVKATLRLYVAGKNLASTGPGSSVLLYYSKTDAANTANSAKDFVDNSFIMIGTLSGLAARSASQSWYEFDVTTAIQEDLARKGPGSTTGFSFRIQLNDDLLLLQEDGLRYVVFTDYSDNNGVHAPELLLETSAETAPKPVTFGLIIATSGWFLLRRRAQPTTNPGPFISE